MNPQTRQTRAKILNLLMANDSARGSKSPPLVKTLTFAPLKELPPLPIGRGSERATPLLVSRGSERLPPLPIGRGSERLPPLPIGRGSERAAPLLVSRGSERATPLRKLAAVHC
jgi:hypothetical protein